MFLNNLSLQLHLNDRSHIPVLHTVASEAQGIKTLIQKIEEVQRNQNNSHRRIHLAAEKIFRIIQKKKMSEFDKEKLRTEIESEIEKENFSVFKLAKKYE
jgi:putative protein kinase ArgK-like GTPase of G3E family